MGIKLRPIADQVVVITGADSGIGLATARAAVKAGARVVINSRSEENLARAAAELRMDGGHVEWHAGDVADGDDMLALAETAVRAFGRIDTWVNNAGVSVYGMMEDVPTTDARRLFDTNYWGTVNGSLAALPYLRANGGALINVGSILSDTSIPLQGHYAASKHAVKAFTDALRIELEHENAPVSVTLVKPGAIDTPYPEHAANYMDAEPRHPKPVYAPEVVANAILECAQHSTRSVTIGGGGRLNAMMNILTPRVAEKYMQATMFDQQKREEPGDITPEDTLWNPPATAGRAHGDQPGHVMRSSAYTAAALHPARTALALGAVALGWWVASGGGVLERGREWLGRSREGGGVTDAQPREQEMEADVTLLVEPIGVATATSEGLVLDEIIVGDHGTSYLR